MKVPASCQPVIGLWNQADFAAEYSPQIDRAFRVAAVAVSGGNGNTGRVCTTRGLHDDLDVLIQRH